MDTGGSIGQVLRQAREDRGLGIQDVQEQTRITTQNLLALEEDRFDSFPNKVYARAFLRDYANFLGLDSAALLGRYEEEWGREPDVELSGPRRTGSFGRKLVVSLLVLVVLGGLAAGAYFLWPVYARRQAASGPVVRTPVNRGVGDVAQLPRAHVPSIKPEAEKKPKPEAAKPEPEKPAPPPVPDTLTIEVTAARPVWADIRVDGVKAVYGNLPAGTRTFEAKQKVYMRVGQGDAVHVKQNGKALGALGTTSNPVTKVFVLEQRTSPAPTTPRGATTPSAVPAANTAGGTAR